MNEWDQGKKEKNAIVMNSLCKVFQLTILNNKLPQNFLA